MCCTFDEMEEPSTVSERSDEQQRLDWRLRWLTSIQSFADTDTQRRRWLDPAEENPHFSYVECMCVYFDDVLWGEDEPYRRRLEGGFLSETEVAAVAEFHALADGHKSPNGDDWNSRAILEDLAWQEVVRAAEQAQHRLLPLLSDPAEREALTRPEHWDDQDETYRAQRTGATIVRLRS